MAASDNWNPFSVSLVELSKESTERILTVDLKDFQNGCPLPHMHVHFSEEDITEVHVLMVGELYTPYCGGFFYFLIRFPQDYPLEPPKVKLITTGGDKVRFGPNLYHNGKVCHSILGTWAEKSWKPEFKLVDVLEVIQSMLQENPYKKEPYPLFPVFPDLPGNDMGKYDDVIRHETLRVAVCDMMERYILKPKEEAAPTADCDKAKGHESIDMPKKFREEMKDVFRSHWKEYTRMCKANSKLNGTKINEHDPFSHIIDLIFGVAHDFNFIPREGKFDFVGIQKRLQRIKEELDKEVDQSWLP